MNSTTNNLKPNSSYLSSLEKPNSNRINVMKIYFKYIGLSGLIGLTLFQLLQISSLYNFENKVLLLLSSLCGLCFCLAIIKLQESNKAKNFRQNISHLLYDSDKTNINQLREVINHIDEINEKSTTAKTLFAEQETLFKKLIAHFENYTGFDIKNIINKNNNLEQTNQELSSLMQDISKTNALCDETIQAVQNNNKKLNHEFTDSINNVNSNIDEIDSRASKMHKVLAGNAAKLNAKLDYIEQIKTVPNKILTIIENIKQECHEKLNSLESNFKNISNVSNNISKKTTAIDNDIDKVINITTNKIEDYCNKLHNNYQSIIKANDEMSQSFAITTEDVNTKVGTIESINNNINATSQQCRNYLDSFEKTVNELDKQIQEKLENIQLTSDQAIIKNNSIMEELYKNNENFIAISQDNSNRISHLIEIFDRNAVEINRTASTAMNDVGEAIDTFYDKNKEMAKNMYEFDIFAKNKNKEYCAIMDNISNYMSKLQNICNNFFEYLDQYNNNLANVNETVDKTSQATTNHYNNMQEMLSQFEQKIHEVSMVTKESCGNISNNIDILNHDYLNNIENISNNSDILTNRIAVNLKESEKCLSKNNQAIDHSYNYIKDQIINYSETIQEQLDKTTNDCSSSIDLASNIVNNLNKQATQLASEMKAIQHHHEKISLNNCLEETSDVIEKLESISIDIANLFHTGRSDKLWKRFYEGEKNVFLNYIADNLSKNNINNLRKLIEKDKKLYDYVLLYLDEYTNLLNIANNTTRPTVLLGTIYNSNIGKINAILSQIVNTEKYYAMQ